MECGLVKVRSKLCFKFAAPADSRELWSNRPSTVVLWDEVCRACAACSNEDTAKKYAVSVLLATMTMTE